LPIRFAWSCFREEVKDTEEVEEAKEKAVAAAIRTTALIPDIYRIHP